MGESNRIIQHDSTVSVWEVSVDTDDFKRRVFDPMIRALRSWGWKVGRNPRIYRDYHCLSKRHRYCRQGDLEAELSITGRHIEFVMFQNVANVSNRNGGRYDFDKLTRAPYLIRKQMELAASKLFALVSGLGDYEVHPLKPTVGIGGVTAAAHVLRNIAGCWHYKPELGRSDWHSASNRTSADGVLLDHATPVYLFDRKGRIQQGVAYYNMNNMWWVVLGRYDYTNRCCRDLYTQLPDHPRRKRNADLTRERLQEELTAAMRSLDFERAALIKRVMLPKQPIYRIWSRKNDSYFAPNFRGYTNDLTRAGLYSEEEVAGSNYRFGDGSHLELREVCHG